MAITVSRPVWRRFAPRFLSRAADWVRAGGHAAVVHDEGARIDLYLTAADTGITEQGLWSVLALEQRRYVRVKEGLLEGLFTARVAPHATEAVLDWCERDSVHEKPTRRLRLDCLACAACCHDSNVVLDDDDLDRFRAAGRADLCTKDYVRRSRDGKVTLRFFPRSDCQHLGDDKKCGIYEIRPYNCRVFPVGSEACLAARESTLGLRDGAGA